MDGLGLNSESHTAPNIYCHGCTALTHEKIAQVIISHVKAAWWVCLDCVRNRESGCRIVHPKKSRTDWEKSLKHEGCHCGYC